MIPVGITPPIPVSYIYTTYAHEPLEKNWNGKNTTFSGNDVPKRAKFMKTFLLKTEKFRPKTVQTAARRVVSDEGKAISMCAY